MQKISIILWIAAVFSINQNILHARTLAEIKTGGTIEIVTTSSSPPHGFLEPKSNTVQGVMIDVGEKIAKHIGVNATFREVPFNGLISTLTSGRADMMSASLFITEERSKIVDFSSPIYGWGEGILVRPGTKQKFRKFEDLQGKKIGVLTDSVQYRMAKELPDAQVTTYKDYPSLILDLRSSRLDVAIVDPPTVTYQLQSGSIKDVELDLSYEPKNKWVIGLSVQKNNEALLNMINDAIKIMKQNGELNSILIKWGIPQLMIK